ncbi:tigger transposable element-derived protein 1 [Trichonephila clavipes]|nr:tigger transposable element-derived protein 1 [Trichonephila clavipes]
MKQSEPSTSTSQAGKEFSASKGWLTGFLKRNALHNIKITGESATADEGAAKIFPEKLAKIIEDGDYSADQVFNADETGLYWKRLPNRTYIAKDEKTASGHKENLTVDGVVGLKGDNDGEEKSTPLTGKLIQKGLQLCSKLENHFLINATNSERASKLQRELQKCMSGYRELYKKIKESSSQSLITDCIVRKGREKQNENEVCENPWPSPQISIAESFLMRKVLTASIGAPDLLSEHLGNSIENSLLALVKIKVEIISTGLLDNRGRRATEDQLE